MRVRSTASQTAPRRIFAVGDSYHGLGGEILDLLDGTGSPLLESDTMQLYTQTVSIPVSKTPDFSLSPNNSSRYSIRRTLLCMWMVYSRATTSAMAERWVGFFDDISELSDGQLSGRIEGGVAGSAGDSLATKVRQRFRG